MRLPDGLYDILKWITLIVLPALATAYVGLATVWAWPYGDEVAKTTAVICTLLGAILGISTAQYNKDVLAAGKADYMSIKREDVSIPDTGYQGKHSVDEYADLQRLLDEVKTDK